MRFDHGIWNAEMTILIGAEKARNYLRLHHEEKDTTRRRIGWSTLS